MDNDEIENSVNYDEIVDECIIFINRMMDLYGTELSTERCEAAFDAIDPKIRKKLTVRYLRHDNKSSLTARMRIDDKSPDYNHIAAIKEVRGLTGWGLKAAKDAVDSIRGTNSVLELPLSPRLRPHSEIRELNERYRTKGITFYV